MKRRRLLVGAAALAAVFGSSGCGTMGKCSPRFRADAEAVTAKLQTAFPAATFSVQDYDCDSGGPLHIAVDGLDESQKASFLSTFACTADSAVQGHVRRVDGRRFSLQGRLISLE